MKPLDDRVPITKIIGQVALLRAGSHNPENGLHEQARAPSGLATITRFAEAMRFDNRH